MADLTALNEAVATLETDTKALIAKVGVEDPAIQAGIDATTVAVTALDGEVKAKLA